MLLLGWAKGLWQKLNKRIVRKPYPIPKINTTLQELEDFTYDTTLDLNMGYYIIRLDPTAAKICTITFPWGKYSYQRLPMGFAGLADIFQAGMGNLMATLEYVRAYIENLLGITKSSHDDHLDKHEQVFIRLHNTGLKVNATMSFFCAQETECLGYILTSGGIKPQTKRCRQSLCSIRPIVSKNSIPWYGIIL